MSEQEFMPGDVVKSGVEGANAAPTPVATRWPNGATRFEQRFGNATTRIVVAIVAIPVILGAVWLGGWAFFLFMSVVMVAAVLEFYWLLEKRGGAPDKPLGIFFGLLLLFGFMHGVSDSLLLTLAGAPARPELLAYARFVLVVGALLLCTLFALVRGMRKGIAEPLGGITGTVAGVVYIPLFLGTLVGIRQTGDIMAPGTGGNPGALIVFAILITIWVCDSAAYFAGRAFGKRKLFERVSPKKTWEGAIAGALAAVGAMIGMRASFLGFLTITDAVVIGVVAGVFGQVGDLAESHLKRSAGVKDSSQLIPGHGGVFDRFDSLLFVSPLVYLYLMIAGLLR